MKNPDQKYFIEYYVATAIAIVCLNLVPNVKHFEFISKCVD